MQQTVIINWYCWGYVHCAETLYGLLNLIAITSRVSGKGTWIKVMVSLTETKLPHPLLMYNVKPQGIFPL